MAVHLEIIFVKILELNQTGIEKQKSASHLTPKEDQSRQTEQTHIDAVTTHEQNCRSRQSTSTNNTHKARPYPEADLELLATEKSELSWRK